MIRLIISYHNRDPLNIITSDFNTSDEFKQKWISESSNNFMVSAPQGGALITKTDVSSFIIDELDDQYTILRRDEFSIDDINKYVIKDVILEFPNGTVQPVEEIKLAQVTTEEEIKGILIPEIVENTEINMPEVAIEEDEEFVVAETIEPTDNKINEKFQSFREKFLDRETKCDSFENSIIEKMDRRLAKLQEFSEVLDGENDYLEEFKQEKLGK